jgi:Secretion system C-terminal sorting domain
MKKIYILAVLMGLFALGQAQTFIVTPSTTVNAIVDDSGSRDSYIYFANNLQQPITLVWEELSAVYPPQWFMTVCDNASCFNIPHASSTMGSCGIGDSTFLKVTCVPNYVSGSGTISYRVYDMDSPTSQVEVTFNFNVQGVSISDSQLDEQFAVSPNPATETIHLSARTGLLDKGNVTLCNLQGQIVLEQNINAVQNADLQVADLAPGIYILRYKTTEKSMTQKVVITH